MTTWSKDRFQIAVSSLRDQALRTITQIDQADRSTIDHIRQWDPKLADLLDAGTTQRKQASAAILAHIESRSEIKE
jgi:hypothetical protein